MYMSETFLLRPCTVCIYHCKQLCLCKCKTISPNDVGMEVPIIRETRTACSKTGNDGIQLYSNTMHIIRPTFDWYEATHGITIIPCLAAYI